MQSNFHIAAFYEFKDMATLGALEEVRAALRALMIEFNVTGTMILATEGFNAALCGEQGQLQNFLRRAESVLATTFKVKLSAHTERPLHKTEVKIKPEIVTLKKDVDIELGKGTHVTPEEWNKLLERDDVLVLDTRNYYEFKSGTFEGAIDPGTTKFSELPQFVEENLKDELDRPVAMFCTGGIRCEKFAPYMRSLGFRNVFQLEGGILKYLEEIPAERSKWKGECFIFDERRSVDSELKQGTNPDYSQEKK